MQVDYDGDHKADDTIRRSMVINDAGSTKLARLQVPKPESLQQKTLVRRAEQAEHAVMSKAKCGSIASVTGGGAWKNAILLNKQLKLSLGSHTQETPAEVEGVPEFLLGGHCIKPSTDPGSELPTGKDWEMKISYTAPVTLYIFAYDGAELQSSGVVWGKAGTSNLGGTVEGGTLAEKILAQGWTKMDVQNFYATGSYDSGQAGSASHTGQGGVQLGEANTFAVYTKEITDGGSTEETIAGLNGEFLGGVVSKPCGTVISVAGGGVPWHPPVVLADGASSAFADVAFDGAATTDQVALFHEKEHEQAKIPKLVDVPSELIGGKYVAADVKCPAGDCHYAGSQEAGPWTLTIKYEPPVKIHVWVWANNLAGLNSGVDTNDKSYNAGLDDVLKNQTGWASESANNGAFHDSESSTHRLESWSKVFKEDETNPENLLLIEGLKGPLVAGVVSTEA